VLTVSDNTTWSGRLFQALTTVTHTVRGVFLGGRPHPILREWRSSVPKNVGTPYMHPHGMYHMSNSKQDIAWWNLWNPAPAKNFCDQRSHIICLW